MNPGKLDKRISFQAATEVTSDSGEVTKTWNTIANGTRWASLEPISGSEGEVAGQVSASMSYIVTLRYMAGITTQHRMVYRGRVFDINSVINVDEAGEELKLTCTESVGNG